MIKIMTMVTIQKWKRLICINKEEKSPRRQCQFRLGLESDLACKHRPLLKLWLVLDNSPCVTPPSPVVGCLPRTSSPATHCLHSECEHALNLKKAGKGAGHKIGLHIKGDARME